MESKEIITDDQIENALQMCGFYKDSIDEGRLRLTELLAKANAGYYNSHTEERFMNMFRLLNKGRVLSKQGRRFICSMIYASSNKKAEIHALIELYRN